MNKYKARLNQIERRTADNNMNDLFEAFGVQSFTTRRQWEANMQEISKLPTSEIISKAGMKVAPL